MKKLILAITVLSGLILVACKETPESKIATIVKDYELYIPVKQLTTKLKNQAVSNEFIIRSYNNNKLLPAKVILNGFQEYILIGSDGMVIDDEIPQERLEEAYATCVLLNDFSISVPQISDLKIIMDKETIPYSRYNLPNPLRTEEKAQSYINRIMEINKLNKEACGLFKKKLVNQI